MSTTPIDIDNNNDNTNEVTLLSRADGVLGSIFRGGSCAQNPKASVHRAWALCIVAVLVHFVTAVVEIIHVYQSNSVSIALLILTGLTAVSHVIVAAVGTFVLRRFPTTFAVGFLLGLVLVLLQQDWVLFGRYQGYAYGNQTTNQAFAAVCGVNAACLALFAGLLFHFKKHIIIAPVDAVGFGRNGR